MKPKDLFSENAADYSAYRPDYPPELFDFIFSQVTNFRNAWDCGTGNGQAAKVLATRFEKVFATDISEKQLINATPDKDIFYSVSPAEKTTFPDNQFDLITVAQAVHWFKFDEFYNELNRVANRKAIVAIWGYGLFSINEKFDRALQHFYKEVVGPFWDSERRFIDDQYSTIPFPFKEIKTPEFYFTKRWSVAQLAGYLSTWSAVRKFIKAHSFNPVERFIADNRQNLNTEFSDIRFPLFLRLGRIAK